MRLRREASQGQVLERGFTLLELAIVIVMFSVLVLIGITGYQAMQRAARLDSAAQQVAGDLFLARSEAVKRNEVVWLARTGLKTYEVEHRGERNLPDGVNFVDGSTDTVKFAPFGPSLTGPANFRVQYRGSERIVEVTASGHPSV